MTDHNIVKNDIHHIYFALVECEPETKFEIITTDENYISLSVGVIIKNFESEAGQQVLIIEHIRLNDSLTSCPNHSSPW